jgi:hypothetical protein
MELYERIDAVIEKMASSRTRLAKQLNIKQTTFNSWFSAKRQDFLWPYLFKIMEFYPHLSREWLFFDEGAMLKSNNHEYGPPVSQSREKELLLKIERLSSLLVAHNELVDHNF